MASTVITFRTRFPEFSDEQVYTDARIQMFLNDAKEDFNQTKLKEAITDRITEYLAAHYLAIATSSEEGDASSTGPVASKSEGDLSVSYAVNSTNAGDSSFYNSTIYGQQYLTLLRTYCGGMLTLNGASNG